MKTPQQKTVEVPVEWIEGLIEAAEETDKSFQTESSVFAGSFNSLIGFISSAKQLLK